MKSSNLIDSKKKEDTVSSRVGSRKKRKPEKFISSMDEETETHHSSKRKHVKLSTSGLNAAC